MKPNQQKGNTLDTLKKEFNKQADRGWFVFPEDVWTLIEKVYTLGRIDREKEIIGKIPLVKSKDLNIKDRGRRLAYKQGWNECRSGLKFLLTHPDT